MTTTPSTADTPALTEQQSDQLIIPARECQGGAGPSPADS
jgi:hypothetical protein